MENAGDYRFESCPDYNLKSQRVGGCDERRVAHIQSGGGMVDASLDGKYSEKKLKATIIQVRILF